MKNISFDYFLPAINSLGQEVYEIKYPYIQGSLKNLVFINTDQGEYVCKANHKELAIKNMKISQIFLSKNIKVPEIRVCSYKNKWFEVYKMVHGKTLFEHITNGISKDKIKNVYKDLLKQFAKMSMVDPELIANYKYSRTYQIAKANISDVNNATMGTIFSGIIRLMNLDSEKNRGIYHCGITPKNIILDNNGNFASLLDLDEIAIADKSYAFGAMAAKYQQMGFDITELFDEYELLTGQEINRKRIKFMSDLNNFGKSILWKTSSSAHEK